MSKKAVNNKLNTGVNNLVNKIPEAAILIYINQFCTNKQNLDRKKRRPIYKILHVSASVTTTVLNKKISVKLWEKYQKLMVYWLLRLLLEKL